MKAELLDGITVTVPDAALEHFEAAFSSVCRAVAFFQNEGQGSWEISAVKERGAFESDLLAALSIAEMLTGVRPQLTRAPVPAGGWLARNKAAFPEQLIGRRFAIRGSHILAPPIAGRITLVLDAGLAFGAGEHPSTRGCLLALERIARRPRRILDLGAGSGILAIAAAKLLRRKILATDIDARAARVTAANARRNGVGAVVHAIRADGWSNPIIRRSAPYDLVFANILARPLCAMARDLSQALAPGGTAILSGLLDSQASWVAAAHRRVGLVLARRITADGWTTLILRKITPSRPSP